MFANPFHWLSIKNQRTAFIASLIMTVVLMLCLRILGQPLITELAPIGIISFELAGNLHLAQNMVLSWGESGRIYAGLNIGLDYLYLFAYSIAIALGCALLATQLKNNFALIAKVGFFLSWVVFAAGLLDAIENYALIKVLLGTNQEVWPFIAMWCAIPKFFIVLLALLYLLLGLVLKMLVSTFLKLNHKFF